MKLRDSRGVFTKGEVTITNCGTCHKSFAHPPSSPRKYCKRKCYTDSKRIETTGECPKCHSTFQHRRINGIFYKRRFCSRSCATSFIKIGTKNPHSPETRRKMSEAQRGEKHHNWKGGIYDNQEKVFRHSPEYKLWRKRVFERDNYTCQGCGKQGGYLEADHELPFALYPDLRLEILNGRTLCKPCHRKTPTFGGSTSSGAYKQWLSADSKMWSFAA